MIKIQSIFSGYLGRPASVLALYDPENQILAISRETEHTGETRPDCQIVSNDRGLGGRYFAEPNFMGAIISFNALKRGKAADGKSPKLVFSDRARSIDTDNFNENGSRYRLTLDTTNGHVAVLGACWYVTGLSREQDGIDFRESLQNGALDAFIDKFFENIQ